MKRLALVTLLLVAGAGCESPTAPPGETLYGLERIDGAPLPSSLLIDFDVTVDLIADTLHLRADSSFVEIAILKGVWGDRTIVTSDSTAGTYTAAGSTLFLLTKGAGLTSVTLEGDSLTLRSDRTFIFRRR